MPLINIPEIETDAEANEELFNSRFNTIVDLLNGNLDADNIADGAITEEKLASTSGGGWSIPESTFSVSTGYNKGNRSFEVNSSTDLTSIITPGYRVKFSRGTTPPTQSTSLNGTNQYWSKTTPSGMTFTDDFAITGFIKLTAYGAQSIVSRYNGTSGFDLQVQANGTLQLVGFNASSANFSAVTSPNAVPLGRWVPFVAQLDMSAFTSTPTTSYIMIDGIDVTSVVTTNVSRGGTNPTALVQAGNLEIGGRNGGLQPFGGSIAQVAIYNAKVTQATLLDAMYQELTGSETSLISYYKFNGSGNDSGPSANNLTGQNSAVATSADNPFNATEYGIVTKITSSVLTIFTGSSGSIPNMTLSSPYYSGQKVPFGFPADQSKWVVTTTIANDRTTTSTSYASLVDNIVVPIGAWKLTKHSPQKLALSGASSRSGFTTLSSNASTETNPKLTTTVRQGTATSGHENEVTVYAEEFIVAAAATTFTLMGKVSGASSTTSVLGSSTANGYLRAICAYL